MDIELRILENRLTRGSRMLQDMEERGIAGPRYDALLRHWLELLAAYEDRSDLLMRIQSSVTPIAAGA